MKKSTLALTAAAILAAAPAARAAVLNDEVTSAKLKEADNTASQDTNSGSGVKTNHLQNKAVTAAKIADGAVGAVQLATGAVTAAKLASGAVGAGAIADGAVTAAKIAGPLGVEKLATYAGVKVVHTGLADGVNTFNSIQAAVDAAYATGAIVKIMPGTYSENVNYTGPVTLQGSGRANTVIVGSFSYIGTGFHPAYLSHLTIQGAFYNAYASSELTDVSISGGLAAFGAIAIRDSYVAGGSTLYFNAFVSHSTLSGYVIAPTGPVEIRDSVLTGNDLGYETVRNAGANVFAVVNSQVATSPAGLTTGLVHFVNCYDPSYTPIPNF